MKIKIQILEVDNGRGIYKGLLFETSESKHVYIDARVIEYARLEAMRDHGPLKEIKHKESVEIEKVMKFNFTNSRNTLLGDYSHEFKSYTAKRAGGHFQSDVSLSYALAHTYSRLNLNEAKIIKINNVLIPR